MNVADGKMILPIFHIISRDQWALAQAAGAHRGDTLDSEGFIHCSTAEQVLLPANALFRGRTDLLLLCIDAGKVQPEIRYEQSGDLFFPHIYGPLNVDAVVNVVDFPPSADGTYSLPRGVGSEQSTVNSER